MQTLTIEIYEAKGLDLIKDLEALNIVRVIEDHQLKTPKIKLSELFRGSITPEEADKLNEYVKQSREEWERPF